MKLNARVICGLFCLSYDLLCGIIYNNEGRQRNKGLIWYHNERLMFSVAKYITQACKTLCMNPKTNMFQKKKANLHSPKTIPCLVLRARSPASLKQKKKNIWINKLL